MNRIYEQVIKGLECCLGKGQKQGICEDCPYNTGRMKCNLGDLHIDALTLLKAQEPETLDAPKPDDNIGCWYDITHNYTLEQVVSALKAQKQRGTGGRTMDDVLISKAAAIDALKRAAYWQDAERKIAELPAVDAALVIHGCWIDVNPDVLLDPRMQCSICGLIEHPLARWKYCPNCGAKMETTNE